LAVSNSNRIQGDAQTVLGYRAGAFCILNWC
jgi:hypothetical protein